jgi:hypothetical protein
VIVIEFVRAWLTVRDTNHNQETLEKEHYEKSLIKKYWTRHLNEKEHISGNTFMIRDRFRWTLFQISLVGL